MSSIPGPTAVGATGQASTRRLGEITDALLARAGGPHRRGIGAAC